MNLKSVSLTLSLLLTASVAAMAFTSSDHRSDNKVKHVPLNQQSGWTLSGNVYSTQAKPAAKKVTAAPKKEVTQQKQLTSLQENLKSANVTKVGDEIKVSFSGNLLFDTGSSDLRPEAQKDIEKLATILQENPNSEVRIEGHTDSLGAAKLNKALSSNRAKSVSLLLQNKGIRSNRINALGLGSEKPVASNKTSKGRQANRRVEVFIR